MGFASPSCRTTMKKNDNGQGFHQIDESYRKIIITSY